MNKVEDRVIFGHKLRIEFVPRDELFPFFGFAVGGVGEDECLAKVREDLPHRLKEFVIAHECYHLVDQHTWWGAYGREIRANLVPGLRDPLGLLLCSLATIFSWARIKLYLHRLWHGY